MDGWTVAPLVSLSLLAGVVQESECSFLLEPEDAQSPGAENHQLGFSPIQRDTDDNNNNIAIIKEICIGRNCFPD